MTSTLLPEAANRPPCLYKYRDFIRWHVEKHGPTPDDDREIYRVVKDVFRDLHSGLLNIGDIRMLRDAFDYTLSSCATLQGHAYAKPFGYPGDFELFDKMYLRHVSPDPRLCRWDEFFHRLDACKAVRNRKTWLLEQIAAKHRKLGRQLSVLIVGSGPGRSVYEYLQDDPHSARFDCVELDPRAIDYATDLCRPHLSQVRFVQGSILRYKTDVRYDLIWSGGLFDYFNDRVFCRALKQLLELTSADGEVIVGNFAAPNSSQGFMELVSDWRLTLRTPDELRELADHANMKRHQVRVENEPTGTNLFLRLHR